MNPKVVIILVGCLFYSLPAAAQQFDMTLSDESAQIRYIITSNGGFGNSEIDLGLLFTQENDTVGMLGIQVVDEAGSGSPGLNVGLGAKGFIANTDSYDIIATAVGGQLRYAPPSLNRFAVAASLFYAPGIVSFMDADNFLYTTTRLEYEVLAQAKVYLGYRRVTAKINNRSETTLDSDIHLGMQILF